MKDRKVRSCDERGHVQCMEGKPRRPSLVAVAEKYMRPSDYLLGECKKLHI